MRKYPNRVRGVALIRPEQVWVADITYLNTGNSNGYLHLITDAYSKQIMGYELCNNLEATYTIKALQMTLKKRKYEDKPLIHHSDRGLQYCSSIYVNLLKSNGIEISMTENGDPYENAIAERVNGILKEEFGLCERFESIDQAKTQTIQSINNYNMLRPHLSCKMLTPDKIKLKVWSKKSANIFSDI